MCCRPRPPPGRGQVRDGDRHGRAETVQARTLIGLQLEQLQQTGPFGGRGDNLQGALFLPAGYEEGKRYPTLTYIYEKLSQGFHAYAQPNATRYSNPAVFTSRGYAFLQPDIVYHVNDPGRSATWCIVPAVKAAIPIAVGDNLRGYRLVGTVPELMRTMTLPPATVKAGEWPTKVLLPVAPLMTRVTLAGGWTVASSSLQSSFRLT